MLFPSETINKPKQNHDADMALGSTRLYVDVAKKQPVRKKGRIGLDQRGPSRGNTSGFASLLAGAFVVAVAGRVEINLAVRAG